MTHLPLFWSLLSVLVAPLAAQPPASLAMATELADLGPRSPGSPTHAQARQRLLGWMIAAGLVDVEAWTEPGAQLTILTGVLPGGSGLEVVLGAHYDSAPGSPGAADNAAGCAVVVAAASRLAGTPRRHSVRVILFDGEERGLAGSSAWIDHLPLEARAAILGMVNVDLVGWNEATRGAVLLSLAGREAALRLPPGWLVNAVVKASRAVGDPIGVATAQAAPLGQLLARSFYPPYQTDAEAFLRGGVPALTLSEADLFVVDSKVHSPGDGSRQLEAARLERWTVRLTAIARRLDALPGRPLADDQYLAIAGRVLSRRDLYWLCLAVWIALVFVGLPGVWRGRGAVERSQRGRAYLPGLTLRVLFLASILTLPVLTTLLLLPAAILCAIASRMKLPWRASLLGASLPWALLLAAMIFLASDDRLGDLAVGLPAGLLLVTSFASMVWFLARGGHHAGRSST